MVKKQLIEELPLLLGFVAVCWCVYLVDWIVPIALNDFGLVPRTLGGLIGIVTMPFLHGSFSHLVGNTVPLIVLLSLISGSRVNSIPTVVMIAVFGAGLLWCFGRYSNHIGASGLVYGLVGFLIAAGFFERRFMSIVVAVIVGFLYGSTLLFGVLPTAGGGVSWEGHLFGAVAGVVVAFFSARGDSIKGHDLAGPRDMPRQFHELP